VSTLLRRGRRTIQLLLAVVVASSFLGPALPGDTEEAPAGLGGYRGSAAASGLHARYNLGDILPLPPPVDIGAPDALSTISSGPQTFARASVLDPGDLLSNPDALLVLASPDYPAGTVPAYPFRITATSGLGAPTAESNPGPGLQARVNADDTGSGARATMPALDAPAVARIGSMTARTTTRTDGSSVMVDARSDISGINVLGLVTIDSVVTELSATSDGNETTFTGGTRVVGAEVLGSPVTIDADGVHQAPGSPTLLHGLLGQLTGPLNDLLAGVGIRITLAGPVELSGGRAGQLGSDGLRIDFELSETTVPALAALIDAVPPLENPIPGAPSIEDILFFARARHLVSIELGRGLVALEARPSASFAPVTPIPTPRAPTLPPVLSGLPDLVLPPAAPITTPPVAQPPALIADVPELPPGSSVGALVLLALLAHPFIGQLLARGCAAVLAPGRSESCSWEER
jgi:hypothetical protein